MSNSLKQTVAQLHLGRNPQSSAAPHPSTQAVKGSKVTDPSATHQPAFIPAQSSRTLDSGWRPGYQYPGAR
jgi:hypothetical protein